jgi:NADPH-dependent ferric siderophore reductase
VADPRPDLVVPPEFGFHVLLGDETALPASADLEVLPSGTRAAFEIHADAERQDICVLDAMELHWLSRYGAGPGTASTSCCTERTRTRRSGGAQMPIVVRGYSAFTSVATLTR